MEKYENKYQNKESKKESREYYAPSNLDRYRQNQNNHTAFYNQLNNNNNLNDLLDKILKQSAQNLRDQTELLEALIEERVKLSGRIMKDLGHERMRLHELISETQCLGTYSSFSPSPTRANLERQLLELEKQRLLEEVNAFKEISKMQQQLQYLKGKYEEEKQRNSLINDNKGEDE